MDGETLALEKPGRKHQTFAAAFFRHFDAEQAYVEAGYNGAAKNRPTNICNLLKNPHMRACMQAEYERLRRKVDLDQQMHAIEVCRLAYSNMRDVCEWDETGVRVKPSAALSEAAARTIQKVTSRTRTRMQGTGEDATPVVEVETEISLHSKTAALDLLHRMYDKSHALRTELEAKLRAVAQVAARYVPAEEMPRYLAEVRLALGDIAREPEASDAIRAED